MKNKKDPILITGGTGFIGSNLIKRLVKNNANVHLVIRKDSSLVRIQSIRKDVTIHHGDLQTFSDLQKIVKKVKPQGIFHLAASNIMSGHTAPDEEVLGINLNGFINLVKSVAEIDYDFLINSGSFLEYGLKDKPIRESDLCNPPELYSISKLSATLYGAAIAKSTKKPIVTLRIFTPYGPFIQKGRLAQQIIYKAITNQEIKLTSPQVTRDFIYIDDLVDLFIKASQHARKYPGEIFNAGSGKKISIGQLVKFIIKATNSNSPILWHAFKNVSYDSDNWQADITKSENLLNWHPQTTLKEGLTKTIDWISNNQTVYQ